jgi:hypothetical protein
MPAPKLACISVGEFLHLGKGAGGLVQIEGMRGSGLLEPGQGEQGKRVQHGLCDPLYDVGQDEVEEFS